MNLFVETYKRRIDAAFANSEEIKVDEKCTNHEEVLRKSLVNANRGLRKAQNDLKVRNKEYEKLEMLHYEKKCEMEDRIE